MSGEDELKLSDFGVLDGICERTVCAQCGVSRRYFCSKCLIPVPALVGRLPQLQLPVNIDIVRHPKEKHGKSTGVHCVVLAGASVRIHLYPNFPDYRKEKAILVFPDRNALTLPQLFSPQQASPDAAGLQQHIRSATRFVFIDCTWFQVGGMRRHEHFESVPTLALEGRRTRYWRPQHNQPEGNLATVEAVYYFCIEYEKWILRRGEMAEYDGRYDDLLYFFEYFRQKVELEQQRRERRLVE